MIVVDVLIWLSLYRSTSNQCQCRTLFPCPARLTVWSCFCCFWLLHTRWFFAAYTNDFHGNRIVAIWLYCCCWDEWGGETVWFFFKNFTDGSIVMYFGVRFTLVLVQDGFSLFSLWVWCMYAGFEYIIYLYVTLFGEIF